MIEIETNRLIIKPYIDADAADMAALHANPVVMDYMKNHRPLGGDEARETFARYLHCWTVDGFSIFSVRLKNTQAFIGECGFWQRTDKPGVSMRFLLNNAYWQQGYGTEMNFAVTRWLFTETDVQSFWAVTQSRNKGSISILRRLGGSIVETAHMGIEGLLRIDVTRHAWEGSRANASGG